VARLPERRQRAAPVPGDRCARDVRGLLQEIARVLPDGEPDAATLERIAEIDARYGVETDASSIPELMRFVSSGA
jgi:hypothetical protein